MEYGALSARKTVERRQLAWASAGRRSARSEAAKRERMHGKARGA
jgi:hypothetical protein